MEQKCEGCGREIPQEVGLTFDGILFLCPACLHANKRRLKSEQMDQRIEDGRASGLPGYA